MKKHTISDYAKGIGICCLIIILFCVATLWIKQITSKVNKTAILLDAEQYIETEPIPCKVDDDEDNQTSTPAPLLILEEEQLLESPVADILEDSEEAVSLNQVKTDMLDYSNNYDYLKRVVVAEAGNQGLYGMSAVAQVIYDRTYLSKANWNQAAGISGVLSMPNQFASPYPYDLSAYEPNVSDALDVIFIQGERVFEEITTYFYNPALSSDSGIEFMQSQKYVGTIKDHEFRTGWDEND